MNKPNIILIMADQLKATALNLYGNIFCNTPALEKLAAEGVLFENAFTPHPLCVPARVSLWTSQYPHSHGSRRNETLLAPGREHAFKLWKEAGYRTGLIGKNHCFGHPDDLALFDTWCEIEHYGRVTKSPMKGMEWVRPVECIDKAHTVRCNMPKLSPRIECAVTDYPEEDYTTAVIAQQTMRFLESHQEEPFALWVSFPDPHNPYEVPRKYADMFSKERIDLPPWIEGEFDSAPERNKVLHEMLGLEQDSIEDIYKVLGVYYGMTRFIDDAIEKIMDSLKKLNLKENTIVVFCSDHGDFMGEHRMIAKGGVFYDCLTRIPMIVSWPGRVISGKIDDSMVNLIDVVPTLLKLQGLEIPCSMQGVLLPTITEELPRDATFAEYGAGGPAFKMSDLEKSPKPYGRRTIGDTLQWREAEGRRKMVRTRKWKYVHDPMGDKDELYHLVSDPWELHNVLDQPCNKEVLADLNRRLADWSIKTEDSTPVALPVTKKE